MNEQQRQGQSAVRAAKRMVMALCILAFSACAQTVYRRDNDTVFRTNADIATLRIGADGSLTASGIGHSVPQRALNESVDALGNAVMKLAPAAALFQ